MKPRVEAQFMLRVEIDEASGCWNWTGTVDQNGYGHFSQSGVRAHRAAYRHWKGPILPGLHIDHRCRNRSCVNPKHLDAVTPAENNRRKLLFKNDSHSYNEIFQETTCG